MAYGARHAIISSASYFIRLISQRSVELNVRSSADRAAASLSLIISSLRFTMSSRRAHSDAFTILLAYLTLLSVSHQAVQAYELAYEPCASIRSYWTCFQNEACVWHPIKGQCVHLCHGRTEEQCLEPGANVCMWIPFHQKIGGVCTNVERTIASKVEMAKMGEEKIEGENKSSPVSAENDEMNEAAESSLSSSPEDATVAGKVVEIPPLEPLNDETDMKQVGEPSSSSSTPPPPPRANVVEKVAEVVEDVPPLDSPAPVVEAEKAATTETVEEMQVEASLPGNAPNKEFIKVDEMASKEDLLKFHGLDDGTLVCPSKSPDDPATSLKIASMWNGMMTVMIDWGDGTPEVRQRMSVGAFSSTNFDHAYEKPGMYAITASATVRRINDGEYGEVEKISVDYLSHVGVRETCNNSGSFFGSVSVNCEAIESETSDKFYLAKVCFGPQKDQILDYSIDWGMAPMDFFTGRVFEMGQLVCHSRLYKESGSHILQVQVENSDGTFGTESSEIVLRQRISVTSSACRIADSGPNQRRLRGLAM